MALAGLADEDQEDGQPPDDGEAAEVVDALRARATRQPADHERDRQHQHHKGLDHHHRSRGQRRGVEHEPGEVADDRGQPHRLLEQAEQVPGALFALVVRLAVLEDDARSVDERGADAEGDGDGE
jgi:hypothetical protein